MKAGYKALKHGAGWTPYAYKGTLRPEKDKGETEEPWECSHAHGLARTAKLCAENELRCLTLAKLSR